MRKLYYESFLLTAIYRATRARVKGESLASQHRYLEFHRRTNRRTMKDNLDVAVAMGFLSSDGMAKLLDDHPDFGRSMLLSDVEDDDAPVRSLFLAGDEPRPEEDYEKAGLEDLKLIVQSDSDLAYRAETLLGDWDDFKRAGSPGETAKLMPHLNKVQKSVVHTDYITIVWWVDAMRKLVSTLRDLQMFYQSGGSPERKRFKKLRTELVGRSATVIKRTREKFGDPWGLIAMDLLAKRSGKAHVRILCDVFVYDREAAQNPS